MTPRALACLVVAAAAAGCGSGAKTKANDPNVVAVGKAPSTAPGVAAHPPCDESRGALLDAEHAEGTRIVEVCASGASPDTIAAVRKAMRLGVDKKLEADALRRDLEAAYATGLLDQIEASARQSGSGSALFLKMQERPRLTGVAFEGVTALAGDPVVAAFPQVGAPLSHRAVRVASERLVAAYAKRGFDEATVNHVVTPDANGGARLKVVVVEGARAKVGKITFDGARGGREAGLRKAVDLAEGAPFDDEKLERAALLATAFYYDNGFVDVRIAPPKRVRAADGTTAITFAIVEGPSFRIGKLTVKNVDAATEKEILAGMKVKPGAIFRRNELVADIEAITARAKQKGKAVTVEPETKLDRKAGTLDVALAIAEAR